MAVEREVAGGTEGHGADSQDRQAERIAIPRNAAAIVAGGGHRRGRWRHRAGGRRSAAFRAAWRDLHRLLGHRLLVQLGAHQRGDVGDALEELA